MADNKRGRESQARDDERRQRERDIAAELDRWDDPEPPVQEATLADLESELGTLQFPVTGPEVVDAVGDKTLESDDGSHAVRELVPEVAAVTFDTPADVRVRVQRPTVAEAMKRIDEAAATVPHVALERSQRNAYERTFLELRGVDPRDDDEGIQVVAEWVVEQLRAKETLPGSRGVRRRAATFCREHGYRIRNDEWLGV